MLNDPTDHYWLMPTNASKAEVVDWLDNMFGDQWCIFPPNLIYIPNEEDVVLFKLTWM